MRKVSRFAIKSFSSAEDYLKSRSGGWIDVQTASGAILRVSRMPQGRFKLVHVESAQSAAQRERDGELTVRETAEELLDVQQSLL